MIARLFAPHFMLVYTFLASVLVVHFRGRERLGFGRQLTDHSTIMAPYNALMYLFSAVPNKPILPVSTIPDLAKLRDNWTTIRDEATALFDEGRIKASDGYNDWGFNSFFRSGWKRFYLKWYGDALPSAERMCPQTVALLKSIPCIKGAMFATLAPGGRLVRHRDPRVGDRAFRIVPEHRLEFHDGVLGPERVQHQHPLVEGGLNGRAARGGEMNRARARGALVGSRRQEGEGQEGDGERVADFHGKLLRGEGVGVEFPEPPALS